MSASSTLWQVHTVTLVLLSVAHVCVCVPCGAEDGSQSLVLAKAGCPLSLLSTCASPRNLQIECLGLTSGDPEFIDLSRSWAWRFHRFSWSRQLEAEDLDQ